MKYRYSGVGVLLLLFGVSARGQDPAPEPFFRVLVFTKTAGFRHGSISSGTAAIRSLGMANGFEVDATEDGSDFNDADLARFAVVIFLNTTGDVLNGDQQAAFERFIRGGGGFVGVHSATDTEYGWPWYGRLVGAYFRNHPAIQNATVRVEDPGHLSTAALPATWARRDEWYNFRANPRGDVHVLATLDEASYSGGNMGADHPIAWCHDFDGGRSWYTAGGHTSQSYSEPLFQEHLLGGILFASGEGSCGGPPPGGRMVPGDCNGDAFLDVSDAVCLLFFLFVAGHSGLPCGDGGVSEPGNRELMDHNDDGDADVSDATSLLLALFTAGPPHPLGTGCRSLMVCPDVCQSP